MSSAKPRNGKVELLRFAFSFVVMFFHIGISIFGRNHVVAEKYTFFYNGYFGVEFFFVLSGFLMASFIYKQRNKIPDLGRETPVFILKKVKKILPLHIIAFVLAFVIMCIVRKYNIQQISYAFMYGIPNLFLVMRSGLMGKDVLTPEWYLCQMFLAMMVLYPLCRKYYRSFSRIVAPLIAVFLVGFLITNTGSLYDSSSWLGIASKSLFRAFAEICAGVFVFEVYRYVEKLNFKKGDKIFLSVVEILCWLSVFMFTFTTVRDRYAGQMLILLCIALCLSFSNATYGMKFFNNKVFYFLGSLSLPLYLLHPVAQRIVMAWCTNFSDAGKVAMFVVVTLALCLVITPLERKLGVAISQKINQLKKN